jgi:preprotein translocase SecE subunit
MEFINNLKNTIEQTNWTEDNVAKAGTLVLAVLLGVSLLFKNSPVRKYAISVAREIKLVEWLKFKDVLRYTALVIVLCVLAALIMSPLDGLFVELKKNYLLK